MNDTVPPVHFPESIHVVDNCNLKYTFTYAEGDLIVFINLIKALVVMFVTRNLWRAGDLVGRAKNTNDRKLSVPEPPRETFYFLLASYQAARGADVIVVQYININNINSSGYQVYSSSGDKDETFRTRNY